MSLAAGAELQHAISVEIGDRDRFCLFLDDAVVDARPSSAYQAAGFAIGRGKARKAEELESRYPAGQFAARHAGLRQLAAAAAALENGARGFRCGLGGFPAMAEGCGFRRQGLLGLVN